MNDVKESLAKVWSSKIVIVCIGSSSVVGDSLGPVVGTCLTSDKNFNVPVFGTLKKNVGASEIGKISNLLKDKYKDYYILCIDATISNVHAEGSHFFFNTPIRPGIGVGKNLGSIGNGCIKGIVLKVSDTDDYKKIKSSLYKTDKKIIKELASRIIKDIRSVYYEYVERESKYAIK